MVKKENPLSKEWTYYILFRFECNLSRKENCQISGGDREKPVFHLQVFGKVLPHLPAHTISYILFFQDQSSC